MSGVECVPGGAPGKAGQPGRGRGRVAGQFDVVGHRAHVRRNRPQQPSFGRDLVRPARLDEQLGLGGAREAADEQRRTALRGAQRQFG
jgi:hypothetical protein